MLYIANCVAYYKHTHTRTVCVAHTNTHIYIYIYKYNLYYKDNLNIIYYFTIYILYIL